MKKENEEKNILISGIIDSLHTERKKYKATITFPPSLEEVLDRMETYEKWQASGLLNHKVESFKFPLITFPYDKFVLGVDPSTSIEDSDQETIIDDFDIPTGL